ncbi:Sec1-binding region of Mso1-domain-containing protein [Scheffersomyces amazonensis]|uniref:Sec1-binding region of Mso1-domain-containing protein n=1 Tax=Scheffersomyces amazonensis TaxID=1078765 RepID=UPI00315CB4A9
MSSSGFFSKFKHNATKLSQSFNYTDKDGLTEDDTLIHNAFVKYFDSQGQVYPDWLEVKHTKPHSTHQTYQQSFTTTVRHQEQSYQPHYNNHEHLSPVSISPSDSQNTQNSGYHRGVSRLQSMHNASRQQVVVGAGYTSLSSSSSFASTNSNHQPVRTNSSTSGSRLRDRIINSTSMNQNSRSSSHN